MVSKATLLNNDAAGVIWSSFLGEGAGGCSAIDTIDLHRSIVDVGYSACRQPEPESTLPTAYSFRLIHHLPTIDDMIRRNDDSRYVIYTCSANGEEDKWIQLIFLYR